MREVLVANDGMMLTNGKTYGMEIYLAEGMRPDDFYEIAIAEYEEIMAAQETDAQSEYDRLGVVYGGE